MFDMNEYRLIFKPLGTISKIPDAQTIFGALCQIMLQTKGEAYFQKYIDSFQTDQPLLVHSSMFPYPYLPMVTQSLFSIRYIHDHLLQQEAIDQLTYLQTMKQYKKIRYVSEKVYQKYLQSNQLETLKADLIHHGQLVIQNGCLQFQNEKIAYRYEQVVNTHVQKTTFHYSKSNPEKVNELYYEPDDYFDDSTQFHVFIRTELSTKEIEELFQYAPYFGFGSRHSVGKNSFRMIQIEQLPSIQSEQQMLLSKCAYDDCFNYDQSHYQIESRLHRTSRFYLNHLATGRFNLLSEGSYMSINRYKPWYGKLLPIEIQNHKLYYYAIGFVM